MSRNTASNAQRSFAVSAAWGVTGSPRWDHGGGAWALRDHIGAVGASEALIRIGSENAVDAPAYRRILLGADGRAARAILLVLVLFIGSIAGMFIGHFVRLSIFSATDRFLGFALGLVHGAVVLGVLVIICQLMRLDGERWWQESLLVPYAERVANVLRTLVGEEHHRVTRV